MYGKEEVTSEVGKTFEGKVYRHCQVPSLSVSLKNGIYLVE